MPNPAEIHIVDPVTGTMTVYRAVGTLPYQGVRIAAADDVPAGPPIGSERATLHALSTEEATAAALGFETTTQLLGETAVIPGTQIRRGDPRIIGFLFASKVGWSRNKSRAFLSSLYGEPPRGMDKEMTLLKKESFRKAGFWAFRHPENHLGTFARTTNGRAVSLGWIAIEGFLPEAYIIVANRKERRFANEPASKMIGFVPTNGAGTAPMKARSA